MHGGTALDRYWAKVDRRGPDECWPWIGYCERYGIFWNGKKRSDGAPVMVKAHRWTYEQFIGSVPDGSNVCHRCDNPPCVNPAHLFIGTQGDNIADMMTKGRHGGWSEVPSERRARGEVNAAAKLTETQVLEIRSRYANGGVSQQALADEYGVHQTIVSAIVRRKVWTHI